MKERIKRRINEKFSLIQAKILILEDFSQEGLVAALENGGYSSLTTADGEKKFFELITSRTGNGRKESYELIILSCLLFETSTEICKKLRKIKEFKTIPLLLVTPDRKDETLNLLFNAGASDYVCRPIKAVDLLSRVAISIRAFHERNSLQGSKKELKSEIKRIKKKEKKMLSLEEAVENMPLGLTIADIDGHIVYSNPAEALIHGYSHSELIGKPARDFSTKPFWKSHTPEKLKNFTLLKRETSNIKKDGTPFPVQLTSSAVKDEKGEPFAIVTICEDITDRKRTEEELANYRNNLESLVEARTTELKKSNASLKKLSEALIQSPSTVMITDREGSIEYVNPAFEKMTLYSAEEVTGKKTSFLKKDKGSRGGNSNIWDRLNKRGTWKGEVRSKKKDGTLYWEKVSISPLIDDDGKLIHYIIVAHDITEQKETAAKLKAAKKMADTANKAKSNFLAHMSHELRTPLSSIMGITELLTDGIAGRLSDKQHELMGDVYESARHLLNIVNDLLDLKVIEEGKMVLEPSTIDVNSLLDGSLAIFRDKLFINDRHLVIEVGSDMAPLYADERRIKQVLINLIGNATKFTPQGGTIIIKAETVHDELEKMKDQVRFSIRDTGPGIRPKDISRLFKPFEQLEFLLNGDHKGTGLGLALSKNIVELHGGTMWVESEWGRGSNFIFTLPAETCRNYQPDHK